MPPALAGRSDTFSLQVSKPVDAAQTELKSHGMSYSADKRHLTGPTSAPVYELLRHTVDQSNRSFQRGYSQKAGPIAPTELVQHLQQEVDRVRLSAVASRLAPPFTALTRVPVVGAARRV